MRVSDTLIFIINFLLLVVVFCGVYNNDMKGFGICDKISTNDR